MNGRLMTAIIFFLLLIMGTGNLAVGEAPYRVHTSVWVNTREFKGKGGIKPQKTTWKTPLCDDFFVLGLKWEDEKLSVYINDEYQYSGVAR